MSRQKKKLEGGMLIAPKTVALEEDNQEVIKQSHIKVNDKYFAIDPNLDFDASTIMCQDRVYVSDFAPTPTEPITFTIQPQFNLFRSLSESRFVFTLRAFGQFPSLCIIPKPYWSQLFVNNFTININNVACNDQHSLTASYAGFVKILLTQGNIKSASINAYNLFEVGNPPTIMSFACDDTRTLQEGIVNLDTCNGVDWYSAYNNFVMSFVSGSVYYPIASIPPYISQADSIGNSFVFATIELTYRPQDGIFLQPKLLPPGVNLNYIISTTSIGTWANGYVPANYLNSSYGASASLDDNSYTYTILKAQYYERQYSITQTGLKAYQSLIMRQPLYFSCITSNTLLYPIDQAQQSVQLTNVFAGRLPNIIVVGLLNQSPSAMRYTSGKVGNNYLFKTYSPQPTMMDTLVNDPAFPSSGNPGKLSPGDCINSCLLTVNGRSYPNLWASNMLPYSNQDVSQWYEQYRQCALISKINGRCDGQSNTNFDPTYKYDNPILTKSEFQSQCTFLCFNIRRNGTLVNCSGDKEVGGIDLFININGTNHANAQLLVCGLNTDSLATITDGGSTTSYIF
tara:strand:+ start:4888 stop:6594 length:1707 start_codon:yes stop_codon:yes gene_type:complete